MKDYLSQEQLDKIEEERIELERKNREFDEDLILEMSTVWGRRNVWRLLEEAKVHSTTFTGNSQTYFLEGKRDIGLWKLAHIMRVCPEKYILMLQERFYKEIKTSEAKNG